MGHHVLRRVTNLAFAFVLAVMSVNLSGVLSLQNASATGAPGNNGTLKVHELGTPSGTESNDPKVCAFNLEGFNFDNTQSGTVIVTEKNTLFPDRVYLPFGPANVSGYAETAYVNNGGAYALGNGHYEATLYGKNIGGFYFDEKAKSKVFKIECQPKFVELCGTANDSYTIPKAESGTYYTINGGNTKITGGTTVNGATGTIVIRHYEDKLINDKLLNTWSNTFSNAPCTTTVPTQAPVVLLDECGVANDKITIPTVTGVVYKVNNTVVSGTLSTNGASSVTITATPLNATYVLSGQTSWTLNFDTTPCPVVVTTEAPTIHTDLCGTASDKYLVPTVEGIEYLVNGNVVSGENSTGGATSIVVTAQAKQGYVLSGNSVAQWTLNFTNNKTCVTPEMPEIVDFCGKNQDKFIIPTQTGVVYKINSAGNPLNAGDNKTTKDVTITAHPLNDTYELVGTASWVLDFSQVKCPAIATKPVLDDKCGTLSDRYNIPSITGVDYKVSTFGILYSDISAGNHWGAGTFYVKAVAQDGYELTSSPNTWKLYLDPKACDTGETSVTFNDECGVANDKFTIKAADHVTYKVATKWIWVLVWIPVEFEEIDPGTYDGNGLVKIIADADPGYKVNGDWFWIHNFSTDTCADITATALCERDGVVVTLKNDGDTDGIAKVNGTPVNVPGNDTVTTTVPYTQFMADVVVTDNTDKTIFAQEFDCTPGMGGGGVIPDVPSNPTTPKTPAKLTGIMLPETGSSDNFSKLISVIVAGLVAYGATFFLINRRDLSKK